MTSGSTIVVSSTSSSSGPISVAGCVSISNATIRVVVDATPTDGQQLLIPIINSPYSCLNGSQVRVEMVDNRPAGSCDILDAKSDVRASSLVVMVSLVRPTQCSAAPGDFPMGATIPFAIVVGLVTTFLRV